MFAIGTLGRRLAEGALALFAALGFLYVPLGRHTGFEHARAIFTTPAASAAFQDVTATVLDLRERAVDFMMRGGGRSASDRAEPGEPGAQGTPPVASAREPRPVPPRLK